METPSMPGLSTAHDVHGSVVGSDAEKQAREAQMQAQMHAEMQRQARQLELQQAQEEAHKCKVCHKPFSTGQQLLQHQLVHNDVRRFQCKFCDKRFKQMSHLQQHHRRHTGERPYKCEIEECGKAFMQLAHLQQHQRNHIGRTRPYNKLHPCDICDRSFSTEAALSVHITELHVGTLVGKDRKCEHCCRFFSSVELYLKHVHKLHPEDWNALSGGRPLGFFLGHQEVKHQEKIHKCSHCDKRFSQKTGLTKHLATHPERADLLAQLFSCPVLSCKKVFTRQTYLIRHLETNPDDDHMMAWKEEQMKHGQTGNSTPSAAKGAPNASGHSSPEDIDMSPNDDVPESSQRRCTRSSTRRKQIRYRAQIIQSQRATHEGEEEIQHVKECTSAPTLGEQPQQSDNERVAMDLTSSAPKPDPQDSLPRGVGPPVFPTVSPSVNMDSANSKATHDSQIPAVSNNQEVESGHHSIPFSKVSQPSRSGDVGVPIKEGSSRPSGNAPVPQAGSASSPTQGPSASPAGPSQPSPTMGKAAGGFHASNNLNQDTGYYLQPL